MKPFLIFLILISLLLASSASAETDPSDYLVGEGDVLKVSVFGQPDLETVSRLEADGNIQLPLIGEVAVAGLSVAEIRSRIEALLADGYFRNPRVSVFIEEYRSKKVIINGQVGSPGVYELSAPTKLLELISKAGGVRDTAADELIINRKLSAEAGGQKELRIDLKRLLETGDSRLNVPIMDGDSLFIPKAGAVFVIGEVAKPGSYKYQEGATVLKVISMAGDFAEFAARNKIRIIRQIDGRETVLEKVALKEKVLAGDIIEVPESLF